MAVKQSAWDIAQRLVDSMPPYLEDNELTVERFWERNRGKMTRQEAKDMLDRLAEAGTFDRQKRRRKGRGGSHVFVYILKGNE
jgi:predicted transcriptional regulator